MDEYSHIKDSNIENINKLKTQITNIEYKQQDLQKYIVTIDNSINQIEQFIHQEQNSPKPNFTKINGLRTAVSKNVELVVKIYDSYKEFENVKFRYYKEIDDNTYRTHKLIDLELKRINNASNTIGDEFYSIMQNLANLKPNSSDPLLNEAQLPLQEPQYDL